MTLRHGRSIRIRNAGSTLSTCAASGEFWASVLKLEGIPSLFALLSQRRLRWLGYVRRMDDGRIPKHILYGELATGSRRTGRPILRYKDTCKRDMKTVGHRPREALAADRSGEQLSRHYQARRKAEGRAV